MRVFDWLTGQFSNRRKALSLYKRGMARARKRDRQGAINDYTTTIAMRDTPEEVKAMALYNRALAHMAAGDETKGRADLNMVLGMDMDDRFVNVRTMARHRLAASESRSSEAGP